MASSYVNLGMLVLFALVLCAVLSSSEGRHTDRGFQRASGQSRPRLIVIRAPPGSGRPARLVLVANPRSLPAQTNATSGALSSAISSPAGGSQTRLSPNIGTIPRRLLVNSLQNKQGQSARTTEGSASKSQMRVGTRVSGNRQISLRNLAELLRAGSNSGKGRGRTGSTSNIVSNPSAVEPGRIHPGRARNSRFGELNIPLVIEAALKRLRQQTVRAAGTNINIADPPTVLGHTIRTDNLPTAARTRSGMSLNNVRAGGAGARANSLFSKGQTIVSRSSSMSSSSVNSKSSRKSKTVKVTSTVINKGGKAPAALPASAPKNETPKGTISIRQEGNGISRITLSDGKGEPITLHASGPVKIERIITADGRVQFIVNPVPPAASEGEVEALEAEELPPTTTTERVEVTEAPTTPAPATVAPPAPVPPTPVKSQAPSKVAKKTVIVPVPVPVKVPASAPSPLPAPAPPTVPLQASGPAPSQRPASPIVSVSGSGASVSMDPKSGTVVVTQHRASAKTPRISFPAATKVPARAKSPSKTHTALKPVPPPPAAVLAKSATGAPSLKAKRRLRPILPKTMVRPQPLTSSASIAAAVAAAASSARSSLGGARHGASGPFSGRKRTNTVRYVPTFQRGGARRPTHFNNLHSVRGELHNHPVPAVPQVKVNSVVQRTTVSERTETVSTSSKQASKQSSNQQSHTRVATGHSHGAQTGGNSTVSKSVSKDKTVNTKNNKTQTQTHSHSHSHEHKHSHPAAPTAHVHSQPKSVHTHSEPTAPHFHPELAGAPHSHSKPTGAPHSHLKPTGAPLSHLKPTGAPHSHLKPTGAPHSHSEPVVHGTHSQVNVKAPATHSHVKPTANANANSHAHEHMSQSHSHSSSHSNTNTNSNSANNIKISRGRSQFANAHPQSRHFRGQVKAVKIISSSSKTSSSKTGTRSSSVNVSKTSNVETRPAAAAAGMGGSMSHHAHHHPAVAVKPQAAKVDSSKSKPSLLLATIKPAARTKNAAG